jgi:ABC transporter substrate binding protein (PQQ-dependent alcohol dehydrogenase system)
MRASSVTIAARLAGAGLAALGTLAALPVHAATFKVLLISPADDPRLDRTRLERAYLGHTGGPASEGVQMALDDSQMELDAAGAKLVLETATADTPDAARAAALKAEKGGAVAVMTDLPNAATLAVADAVKLPVLNTGNASDVLRQSDCRARLYHLLASERMRADALAQTLVAQRWSQVLLLTGPSAADAARSADAQAAIKRYGLKLVANRPFKLSGDPRERNLANPRLLTGGINYDVVWVVDSDGEFARTLPYQTVLPRPVVGDAGLTALAWHASFERYGAPQVSHRFERQAHRPMTAQDWAAWMAGKALVAAVEAVPNGKGGAPAVAAALAKAQIDGSEGVTLDFRPWDGQLRQTLLLTDGQGVVAVAPADGVLHPRNVLDTLGVDEPEKLCKVAR